MAKKITHKDRILNHLQYFGYITTWEAIKEYNCTRLSEYIRQLREDGHMIENEWVEGTNKFGDKIRYCNFILKGD